MTACLWCTLPFTPRRSGGKPQRFCSPFCRHQFWSATRRWVMKALDAGLLSVSVLKGIPSNVRVVSAPISDKEEAA